MTKKETPATSIIEVLDIGQDASQTIPPAPPLKMVTPQVQPQQQELDSSLPILDILTSPTL